MRTLEFKDIACYIPHKPKCHIMGGYDDEENIITFTATGFSIDSREKWIHVERPNNYGNEEYYSLEDTFFLLRPMTDLVKEIVVDGYNDGKPFVPAKKLFVNNIDIVEGDIYILYPIFGGCMSRCLFSVDTYCLSYKQIELLNQWNFDYKGLIKEGLVVDINTINK